jgi:A/G-specific adenine glycosylase
VPDPSVLARPLARWFSRAQRDLAWRRTRDPYAVWVSEVMLQQTRVETVQAYWPRFLARFPDVHALAAADEEAVLEAWSGLGYYRRARLLHRGARFVAAELDGRVPADAASLRRVPGIGPYTAGAIASIAFDRPAPLVDGNVARVLSRVDGIEDPGEQGAGAARHWSRVEEILRCGSPRVLAQALMELGALVCVPRSPRCGECPLRRVCVARAAGTERSIPAPRPRRPLPVETLWALAIRSGDALVLERRPATGLLAGLWCLPVVARAGDRVPAPRWLGVPIRFSDRSRDPIEHVFTHRIWRLTPIEGRARRRPRIRARSDARELCLVRPGERPPGGIPRVTEKLLACLRW